MWNLIPHLKRDKTNNPKSNLPPKRFPKSISGNFNNSCGGLLFFYYVVYFISLNVKFIAAREKERTDF